MTDHDPLPQDDTRLNQGIQHGPTANRPRHTIDHERLRRAIAQVKSGHCPNTPSRHHGISCGHPFYATDIGFAKAVAQAYEQID